MMTEVMVKSTQHLREIVRDDQLVDRMNKLALGGWVLESPEELEHAAQLEFKRETVTGEKAVVARVNELSAQGWKGIQVDKANEETFNPDMELFHVSCGRTAHVEFELRGTRTITRLLPMILLDSAEHRDVVAGRGVPGYLPGDDPPAPSTPDFLPEDVR